MNSLWACARLGYHPGDAFLEAQKGSRRAQGHPKELQDVQEKVQLHFFEVPTIKHDKQHNKALLSVIVVKYCVILLSNYVCLR